MIDVFMPYKIVNQLNSITPVVWDHVKRNTLPICADRTAHAESDRQSEVTRANLLLIIMCNMAGDGDETVRLGEKTTMMTY